MLDNYLTKPDECPDPSPESEKVFGILKGAGLDEAIIDQITDIVDALVDQAANCPECARRACAAEVATQEEIDVAVAGYEEQERERWANMTEEEREAEVDRMINEDPTCRE